MSDPLPPSTPYVPPQPTQPRGPCPVARRSWFLRDRAARGPWRGGTFLTLAMVVGMLALPFFAAPNVRGDEAGLPTYGSFYLVANGTGVVIVGFSQFLGTWVLANNNSQVYTNQFQLVVLDLTPHTIYFVVPMKEENHGWSNLTISAAANQQTVFDVNFPPDTNWENVELDFGHGEFFVTQVSVPESLLPLSSLNLGGLDFLAMIILSECIVAFSVLLWTAQRIMRKALWAPPFRMSIWGHVVLAGFAGIVIVNYQWVNQTFAGWSPLVYVFALVPLIFLYSLQFFNYGGRSMILQRTPTSDGKISYKMWFLRVSELDDGRLVMCEESWWGFFLRCLNHHVVLQQAGEDQLAPFCARVIGQPSPTRTTSKPNKGFPVRNWRSDPRLPQYLYWTRANTPVQFVHPKWVGRKEVTLVRPAVLGVHGEVVKPERRKTVHRFVWPHIVDGNSTIELLEDHYEAAEAVNARWASIDELINLLKHFKIRAYTVEAHMSQLVRQEVNAVAENWLRNTTQTDVRPSGRLP